MSLATELLSAWAPIMRSVELRSGTSGRFEVTLDGELIFSKVALKRHPRPKEISDEFEKRIGKPLEWRQA